MAKNDEQLKKGVIKWHKIGMKIAKSALKLNKKKPQKRWTFF